MLVINLVKSAFFV